jgi:hypothetical protein
MNALDSKSRWRFKIHEVIFEADTPAGKWFDVLLIVSILVSVLMVMLDSVSAIQKTYGQILLVGEWSGDLYSGRPVFYDYPVIAGSADFSNFKTGTVSGRGPFTDAGIASQST